MKNQLILLVIVAMVVFMTAFGGEFRPLYFVQDAPIDSTGDSAQMMALTIGTAVDSFPFACSLMTGPMTAGAPLDTFITAWTSPPQVLRILIDADTDVPDTTMTYSIDFDFGTNTVGFDCDYDDVTPLTLMTVAGLIDALVDSINTLVTATDTVIAEDSVTYILLRSKIAQDDLEGGARWTVTLGDSLTAGATTITTVEMWCDSFAATINADVAGAALYVTASDSTDSIYIISDDRGLPFEMAFLTTDDELDSNHVLVNYSSWTSFQDTLVLFSMCCPETYTSLLFDITMDASATTDGGYGTLDSGYLWLWAYVDDTSKAIADRYFLLACDTTNSLPITLRFPSPSAAGTDTLYKTILHLEYRVADSATDLTATPTHYLHGSGIVQ